MIWEGRLRRLAAMLTVGALLVVSACGDDDDDGTTSAAAADGEEASQAQADLAGFLEPPGAMPDWPAITAEIPEDVVVYYLARGNETSAIIEDGLKSATGLLGWDLESLTVSDTDPTSFNSTMLSAIQAGADAIVMTTADSVMFSEALAAAEDAGIPVAQIGSTEPEAFAGVVDSIAANSDKWGQMMAAAVIADAEAKGETAHVGTVTAAQFAQSDVTLQAFNDHITQYCPDCSTELIDAPVAELFSGQASNSVISALQRNPDINYLFFGFGPTSIGVRGALDSTGFESVRTVGQLPTPTQLQEMKDPGGAVGWLVAPNQFDAYASIDVVLRALTGGDPTIHNDETWPAWILQEDSDFDAATLPELPIDYTETFGALWGVS
jgi:ABC-type sugar transport system substrate-binding protein